MEAVWSFVDLSRRHLPPHDPKAAAHIAVDDDVLEKAEVSLERQSQRHDDASGQGEGEEWHQTPLAPRQGRCRRCEAAV
jgi:hypothetical protein